MLAFVKPIKKGNAIKVLSKKFKEFKLINFYNDGENLVVELFKHPSSYEMNYYSDRIICIRDTNVINLNSNYAFLN
jgi:hypothetical protein